MFVLWLLSGTRAPDSECPTITPTPSPSPNAINVDDIGYSCKSSFGAAAQSSNVELVCDREGCVLFCIVFMTFLYK